MIPIFFLASDLSPVSTARHLARLVALLPRDRFHVQIGVLGKAEGPIAEWLKGKGLAVQSLPARRLVDLGGASRLRKFTDGAKIIHAWGPAAVRASALLGDRKIVATDCSVMPPGVGGWMATRALRRCQRVVSFTFAEGDRYRKLGVRADALTRIAPGIEPPPLVDRAALLRELELPPQARFIAAAGPLEPASGFRDAILVFDLVRYEYPDLHFVIFGEGSERESLHAFARSLMFDDWRIRFAPARLDLPGVLAESEFVWVTAERGDPLLALETMAAGRPVMGWKVPDMAEVMEDEITGILVERGDRARLASASYPYITDDARRSFLGDSGRLRSLEHFNPHREVEQYVHLYEELA